MSDDLALDAPVLDDDQIQDEPIEGEGAEERPESDATDQQQTDDAEGDGRTVPAYIKALKDVDPERYRKLKADYFTKKSEIDSWESRFKAFGDDGIKEVDAVIGLLAEHGGREGIVSTLGELSSKATELDGINAAIANGDPELVKEIAELHPESFGRLAEATINQWAQTHPEDYSRVMSGIVASTIQGSGIPMFLERMGMYLEMGKTQELAQAIQQLQQWSGSFGQAAAKQPAQTQPRTEQVSQREAAISQREQKIYSDNYLGKLDAQRKPMIEEALKDYIAMRPDAGGTKDRAIKAAIESVEMMLGKDQQFVRAVQAFHAKGDAEGALRLVKSRESRVIAEIAKTVGEDFYGKLAPKPAAKPAVQAKPAIKPQAKPGSAPTKPKDRFAEIFASA